MCRVSVGLLVCGLVWSSVSEARELKVGLGYLPNIQFAPFYVADAQGFYKKEGVEVQFQHGFTSQLMPLLLSGKLDYLVGDAEDVLLARSAGQPVKYVFAMYQKVPVALFSLASRNIVSGSDLKGKTIGFAGAYGSGYYALRAILKKYKLTERDVNLQAIGFTQLDAVQSNRVDAAVGFINNEPLVLRRSGVALNVIEASPYYPMVGNGIITMDRSLREPAGVKAFLGATQKALAWTIANPKKAFETSKKYIDRLDDGQMDVLNTSISLMQSPYTTQHGLGYSDPSAWSKALSFLKSEGLIKTSLSSSVFFSNAYLTPHIR